MEGAMTEDDDWLVLVPKPALDKLNQRQAMDYRDHKRRLASWALTEGKDVDRKNGYAATTVKNRLYRIDKFYRWVWDEEGGYTTAVTHDHANGWVEELAYSAVSGTHKNHCLKALRMLFKWRHHHFGEQRWYPRRRFDTASHNPQDFLTKDERRRIRGSLA